MTSEKIDIWNNWRNIDMVTDDMILALKKECGCEPNEGLMDVSLAEHRRVFGEVPEGAVCWLKVDNRVNNSYLNKEKIVYTSIYGERIHIQPDPLKNKNTRAQW